MARGGYRWGAKILFVTAWSLILSWSQAVAASRKQTPRNLCVWRRVVRFLPNGASVVLWLRLRLSHRKFCGAASGRLPEDCPKQLLKRSHRHQLVCGASSIQNVRDSARRRFCKHISVTSAGRAAPPPETRSASASANPVGDYRTCARTGSPRRRAAPPP